MIWGFCPTGGLIGGFAPLVVKISSYILTAAIEFPYVHRNTFLKSTFKSKGEKNACKPQTTIPYTHSLGHSGHTKFVLNGNCPKLEPCMLWTLILYATCRWDGCWIARKSFWPHYYNIVFCTVVYAKCRRTVSGLYC